MQLFITQYNLIKTNNMEKTAVEWLQESLLNTLTHEQQMQVEGLFQQAKAMEKEQIIKAHYEGGCYFHESRDCRDAEVPYINDAEDYYNQTYNKIK